MIKQNRSVSMTLMAVALVAALAACQKQEGPGERAGKEVDKDDIVRAFEQASGRAVPYRIAPRRSGDLAEYWADATKAQRELGWQATRGLDQMMLDTWRWQSGNPDGYR